MRVAKRRQAEEAEQLVGQYPESFELKCTSKAKGRLGGVRARLRVDVNAQGSVRIADELAGKVIECVMRDGVRDSLFLRLTNAGRVDTKLRSSRSVSVL